MKYVEEDISIKRCAGSITEFAKSIENNGLNTRTLLLMETVMFSRCLDAFLCSHFLFFRTIMLQNKRVKRRTPHDVSPLKE